MTAASATPENAPELPASGSSIYLGMRILPKAETEAEARVCLALISGRRHRVFSCIVLTAPGGRVAERLADSAVTFARLSPAQVEAYLGSGEWRGKAGGYAIQGLAGAFVLSLIGSYGAVVGLPLYETACLLEGAGYDPRVGWREAPA